MTCLNKYAEFSDVSRLIPGNPVITPVSIACPILY